VLAAVLYGLTCAPGVLWQDSAVFQYRVWKGDYHGQLGLALAHPMYIGLAKCFSLLPVGHYAFRVNLFSGLCAAISLTLLADLLWRLTRSWLAASSAVILLGVSHTFWKHAVIAEVLSLYGLGLIVELCLLERFFTRGQGKWLIAALFVNGLSTSNHLLATLHLPAYAFLALWAFRSRGIDGKGLVRVLGAYLLGLAPYLSLMGVEIWHGRPLGETLRSALFGEVFQKDVLNTSFSLARQLMRAIQYFSLNFPTPLALVAPVGLIAAWRDARTRWFAAFGGGVFFVAFAFAFRYPVADQYVFFFPCYIIFAAFVAPAVAQIVKTDPARRAACMACAILPALVYEVGPVALKRFNVPMPFRQDVPFRNAYAYYLRPRANGEESAERFARAALLQAAPDGLLIADFTVKTALIYVRDVLGDGRGVTLNLPCDVMPFPPVVETSEASVRPFAARGAAYIATNSPAYVPEWIPRQYDLLPAGPIYRLSPKSQPAAAGLSQRLSSDNGRREPPWPRQSFARHGQFPTVKPARQLSGFQHVRPARRLAEQFPLGAHEGLIHHPPTRADRVGEDRHQRPVQEIEAADPVELVGRNGHVTLNVTAYRRD
jgi:hypothetical protein